jgi:hypothetical protein
LREGPLQLDSLHNYIDSVALYIEEARIRNFTQWPIIGVYVNWNGFVGATYEEDLDYLKWYIDTRIAWMDSNLPGNCDLALPEEEVRPEPISRAWPNPFSDFLFIGYTTNEQGQVRIQIHDMVGKVVEDFDLGNLPAGNYIKEWSLIEIPAGVYLYSIYVNDEMIVQDKIVRATK